MSLFFALKKKKVQKFPKVPTKLQDTHISPYVISVAWLNSPFQTSIVSLNLLKDNRVRYFRGRVSYFDQSEAKKHRFLASDWSGGGGGGGGGGQWRKMAKNGDGEFDFFICQIRHFRQFLILEFHI